MFNTENNIKTKSKCIRFRKEKNNDQLQIKRKIKMKFSILKKLITDQIKRQMFYNI